MAISNYPQIINGTYDLYVVPFVTPGAEPLQLETIANSYFLGCTQEGFTLSWTHAQKEIQTDCLGDTAIDHVNRGITGVRVSGVFMEWNHVNLLTAVGTGLDAKRANIQATMWPSSSGEFGDLDSVGEQVLASDNLFSMAAVPRTGTPAAADNHTYYFLACWPDMGSEFTANFNLDEQIVPFSFECHPVPHYDNLGTHTIVTPKMDLASISSFTTNYTLRFFYLDDVA